MAVNRRSEYVVEVLADPSDDEIGHLKVVLVLHEHVAVAAQASIGERDKGHVAAGCLDLLHFREASRIGLLAEMIADHDQDWHLGQHLDLFIGQVAKATGLELDYALDAALALEDSLCREASGL